jgi:hypothetical protein
MEENKETLEEFIKEQLEGYDEIDFSTYEKYIKLGANWQQEQDKKMYSEQDLIDFVYFINGRHFNKYTVDTDEVDLFIEQFKNKTNEE